MQLCLHLIAQYGSLTRAQSDGLGAAKLGSFLVAYSAIFIEYKYLCSNGLWLLNQDKFKLLPVLIKWATPSVSQYNKFLQAMLAYKNVLHYGTEEVQIILQYLVCVCVQTRFCY